MKNIIFTSVFMLISQLSFGQGFTQAANNTGFTYDCDNLAPTGITWYDYYPNCAVSSGGTGAGGWDAAPVNELKYSWGQAIDGKVYDFIGFTTALDFSSAANQKIQVDLKSLLSGSALPLTYQVWLEKGYAGSTVVLTDEISVSVTGTYQTFLIDFSTHIKAGQNLSVVDKIVFKFDNCPHTTTNGDLYLMNFSGGSSVVATAITDAEGIVSTSNLFPNPTTGVTNIALELGSSSDVKITLMDIYGIEVKTIVEGNYTSINQSFDVSNVAKGLYYVNYQINGKAAKVQKLVVR